MTGAEHMSQSVVFVDAPADEPQRPERLRWYATPASSPNRAVIARLAASPVPRVDDRFDAWLQRASVDDAARTRSI